MGTCGIFDPVTGAIDTGVPRARAEPVAGDEDITEQTAVGERTSSRLVSDAADYPSCVAASRVPSRTGIRPCWQPSSVPTTPPGA